MPRRSNRQATQAKTKRSQARRREQQHEQNDSPPAFEFTGDEARAAEREAPVRLNRRLKRSIFSVSNDVSNAPNSSLQPTSSPIQSGAVGLSDHRASPSQPSTTAAASSSSPSPSTPSPIPLSSPSDPSVSISAPSLTNSTSLPLTAAPAAKRPRTSMSAASSSSVMQQPLSASYIRTRARASNKVLPSYGKQQQVEEQQRQKIKTVPVPAPAPVPTRISKRITKPSIRLANQRRDAVISNAGKPTGSTADTGSTASTTNPVVLDSSLRRSGRQRKPSLRVSLASQSDPESSLASVPSLSPRADATTRANRTRVAQASTSKRTAGKRTERSQQQSISKPTARQIQKTLRSKTAISKRKGRVSAKEKREKNNIIDGDDFIIIESESPPDTNRIDDAALVSRLAMPATESPDTDSTPQSEPSEDVAEVNKSTRKPETISDEKSKATAHQQDGSRTISVKEKAAVSISSGKGVPSKPSPPHLHEKERAPQRTASVKPCVDSKAEKPTIADDKLKDRQSVSISAHSIDTPTLRTSEMKTAHRAPTPALSSKPDKRIDSKKSGTKPPVHTGDKEATVTEPNIENDAAQKQMNDSSEKESKQIGAQIFKESCSAVPITTLPKKAVIVNVEAPVVMVSDDQDERTKGSPNKNQVAKFNSMRAKDGQQVGNKSNFSTTQAEVPKLKPMTSTASVENKESQLSPELRNVISTPHQVSGCKVVEKIGGALRDRYHASKVKEIPELGDKERKCEDVKRPRVDTPVLIESSCVGAGSSNAESTLPKGLNLKKNDSLTDTRSSLSDLSSIKGPSSDDADMTPIEEVRHGVDLRTPDNAPSSSKGVDIGNDVVNGTGNNDKDGIKKTDYKMSKVEAPSKTVCNSSAKNSQPSVSTSDASTGRKGKSAALLSSSFNATVVPSSDLNMKEVEPTNTAAASTVRGPKMKANPVILKQNPTIPKQNGKEGEGRLSVPEKKPIDVSDTPKEAVKDEGRNTGVDMKKSVPISKKPLKPTSIVRKPALKSSSSLHRSNAKLAEDGAQKSQGASTKRVRFAEPSQPLRTSGRNVRLLQLMRRRHQRSLRKASSLPSSQTGGSSRSFPNDVSISPSRLGGSTVPDKMRLQEYVDELQYLLDGIFRKEVIPNRVPNTLVISSLHALIRLSLRKDGRAPIQDGYMFNNAMLKDDAGVNNVARDRGVVIDMLTAQPELLTKIVRKLCTMLGKSCSVDALIALFFIIVFRSAGTTLVISETELEILINVFVRNCALCLKEEQTPGTTRKISERKDEGNTGLIRKRGMFAKRNDDARQERVALDTLNELVRLAGVADEDTGSTGSSPTFVNEADAAAYLIGTGLAVLLGAASDVRMWMRENRRLDRVVAAVYSSETLCKKWENDMKTDDQIITTTAAPAIIKQARDVTGWRIVMGGSLRILQFSALDEVCQARITAQTRVVAISVAVVKWMGDIRIGSGLDCEWVICNALKLCINLMRGADEHGSSQFVKAGGVSLILDCLVAECIASRFVNGKAVAIAVAAETPHASSAQIHTTEINPTKFAGASVDILSNEKMHAGDVKNDVKKDSKEVDDVKGNICQKPPVYGKCEESFDVRVLCLALLANAVDSDLAACEAFPSMKPSILNGAGSVGALTLALEILTRSGEEDQQNGSVSKTEADRSGMDEFMFDDMKNSHKKAMDTQYNDVNSNGMERKITIGYVCLLIGALVRRSSVNRGLLVDKLSEDGLHGIAEVLQEFLEFHHEVGVLSASIDEMYGGIIKALKKDPNDAHERIENPPVVERSADEVFATFDDDAKPVTLVENTRSVTVDDDAKSVDVDMKKDNEPKAAVEEPGKKDAAHVGVKRMHSDVSFKGVQPENPEVVSMGSSSTVVVADNPTSNLNSTTDVDDRMMGSSNSEEHAKQNVSSETFDLREDSVMKGVKDVFGDMDQDDDGLSGMGQIDDFMDIEDRIGSHLPDFGDEKEHVCPI